MANSRLIMTTCHSSRSLRDLCSFVLALVHLLTKQNSDSNSESAEGLYVIIHLVWRLYNKYYNRFSTAGYLYQYFPLPKGQEYSNN